MLKRDIRWGEFMKSKIIFLSYCWANTKIATEVDETLQSCEGIEIMRDISY